MGEKFKRIMSFFVVLMFTFPNFAYAATFEAWVAPSNINLTIKTGESGTFDLLTTTGTPPIKKLDIVFAIDRTGSMGGVIEQVKSTAVNIMNNVKSKVPDSQFGVMAFQDYPDSYSYSGYSSTYGGSEDKVYEMLQTVTDNSASVTSAISSIYASGGADCPEAYTRVLYETGNGTPNWRTDSKKVVILLGDAPTHDEDFAGFNYGGDPGLDGIAGTADDLQFEDVVQGLNDKKITVLAIQAGSADDATATFKGASIGYGTAVGTAGQYFAITDSTQVTTEIMKMVTEEVLNIKEMSLTVPDQYKSWFTTNPGSYFDVGPSTSNSFNVTISVPAGTPTGEYSFPINVLGDGSVLNTSNVKINVTPGAATGSGVLEIASADYGVLENGGTANITINRLNGSTGTVSANYSTADGTAKATQDYTATNGAVTFADGEISKTISVPILNDTINDTNENFYFKISSPTGGATLGSTISSKITIADDEIQKPGILEFGSFSYDEATSSDKAEITVTRTAGSDGAVTVNYATSDSTAAAGVEYTATSGALTFNAGETTKSFYVPINKAAVFSGVKSFNITLSNPTNGSMLGVKSTTVVNIKFVPSVSSMSINPTEAALEKGQQQQLTVIAVMNDGSGKDITNSSTGTTYSSSNTSVATVDANGLVTASSTVADGSKAVITAKNGTSSVSSVITVGTAVPTVINLTVNPTTVTLAKGNQQQLTVTAAFSDGTSKDVTNSSEGTTYTSSNTAVATVDANGVITVLPTATVGYKASITANNGGRTASCIVTVDSTLEPQVSSLTLDPTAVTLGKGEQKQLVVTGTLSDGTTKDVTSGSEGTTYTLSDPTVATVDANGLITVSSTTSAGYKTVISAKNNGRTVSCVVTVGAGTATVNSISINPTAVTLLNGEQKQLVVTGTLSDGTTKDVTSGSEGTTYTSSDSTVATVDANGLITVSSTVSVGYKTVISAKNNGKTVSCIVTVGTNAITLSSIGINPTAVTLAQGEQKQLAATATFSDGSTKDITSSSEGTTYASSNTAVATVDANGLITVLSTAPAGSKTVISVKNSGKTVSCVVTAATGATVSSVSINPAAVTLINLEQKQMVVTATLSDGTTKDITSSSEGTTYASSNTAVATVDANGLVTVLSTAPVGSKTIISAKNSGRTVSCIVTVGSGAATVSSISVNPTAVTLAKGEQKQLVVTGTLSDGTTKDITNSSEGTTYTSSNTTVATVDANGLITVLPTATAGYKTVISVKNNGKTISCVVTVGAGATVSAISISPTSVTLAVGEQKQLVVTGTLSDGTTKDITNSSEGTTYASSNTSVATVDANGLVTVLLTAPVGSKTVISAKNSGRTISSVVTVGTSGGTVSSFSVNPTAVTLAAGGQKQLVITGTLSDGTTKDITNSSEGTTYTSSNTAVATVDANGLITVLPTATAGSRVVISVKNSGKTVSCVVTVGTGAATVSSITVNPTAVTLAKGVQKQLVVTGTLSDGTTKDVTNSSEGTTYTSNNTTVATVDANGLITVLPTAISGYKTSISVKNNGKIVSCIVTVS